MLQLIDAVARWWGKVCLICELILLALALVIPRAAWAETRVASLVPGAAPSDALVTANATGCALTTDGHVACWGQNTYGHLGRDTTERFNPNPALVIGLDQVVSLAAGNGHLCALRQDGSVWCWGWNYYGQLGDGTTKERRLPVKVTFPGENTVPKKAIVRITAGGYHTCALDNSNHVYCWGKAPGAGLGTGVTSSNTPTLLPLANVVSIHSGPGAQHTCAIVAGGSMVCWGDNAKGQLGNGTQGNTVLDPSTAPTVQLPTTTVPFSSMTTTVGVASVSMSGYHTCISTDSGQVYCWGDNSYGRVTGAGSSTGIIYPTPQLVTSASPNQLQDITQVSTEVYSTCARRGDGHLYCWGQKYGSNGIAARPETDVYWISGGGAFECLFRRSNDGTVNGVYCSGNGSLGALGLPNLCNATDCTNAPGGDTATTAKVAGSFKFNHIGSPVVTSGSTTCFRPADGTLKCWGANYFGQVGDNSTINRLTATSVVADTSLTPIPAGEVAQITGGESHNCMLKWDGTVSCWGSYTGQGATNSSIPVQIAGLSGIVQLAGGMYFTCALTATGSAYCWGNNSYGSLGNGTTTRSNTPVQVGYVSGSPPSALVDGTSPQQTVPIEFSSLAAGAYHVCGMYKGLPVCWGQLPDRTLTRPTPKTLPAHTCSSVLGCGTPAGSRQPVT